MEDQPLRPADRYCYPTEKVFPQTAAMISVLRFCFLVLLSLATGCKILPGGGSATGSAVLVDAETLQSLADREPIFYFLGRKDGFHYFEIPEAGFYRVANGTAATDMPVDLPGKNPFGSVGLFVVFRDGKLATPTSDEIAEAGIETTPSAGG